MAESEEELKSLLMKVKVEATKNLVSGVLNIYEDTTLTVSPQFLYTTDPLQHCCSSVHFLSAH